MLLCASKPKHFSNLLDCQNGEEVSEKGQGFRSSRFGFRKIHIPKFNSNTIETLQEQKKLFEFYGANWTWRNLIYYSNIHGAYDVVDTSVGEMSFEQVCAMHEYVWGKVKICQSH